MIDQPTTVNAMHVKKIIHADMDCFYAAVECLAQPHLKNTPMVVAGHPAKRGVICTANYPARKFGIRSAMATAYALKLYPNLVVIPPQIEKYQQYSEIISEIFAQYSSIIQPMSLDEAYIDVTEHPLWATTIAQRIKQEVLHSTGLTISCGVAPNKLVAKIASDFNKPNGLTVVKPHQVADFMAPLSLRSIPGIGPKTFSKLEKLNLKTCSDLRDSSFHKLSSHFGDRFAKYALRAANGIDDSLVETTRIRKSISKETTFHRDSSDPQFLQEQLNLLVERVIDAYSRKQFTAKAVIVKIKTSSFQVNTKRSKFADLKECKRIAWELLHSMLQKSPGIKLRLIGFGFILQSQ